MAAAAMAALTALMPIAAAAPKLTSGKVLHGGGAGQHKKPCRQYLSNLQKYHLECGGEFTRRLGVLAKHDALSHVQFVACCLVLKLRQQLARTARAGSHDRLQWGRSPTGCTGLDGRAVQALAPRMRFFRFAFYQSLKPSLLSKVEL